MPTRYLPGEKKIFGGNYEKQGTAQTNHQQRKHLDSITVSLFVYVFFFSLTNPNKKLDTKTSNACLETPAQTTKTTVKINNRFGSTFGEPYIFSQWTWSLYHGLFSGKIS